MNFTYMRPITLRSFAVLLTAEISSRCSVCFTTPAEKPRQKGFGVGPVEGSYKGSLKGSYKGSYKGSLKGSYKASFVRFYCAIRVPLRVPIRRPLSGFIVL